MAREAEAVSIDRLLVLVVCAEALVVVAGWGGAAGNGAGVLFWSMLVTIAAMAAVKLVNGSQPFTFARRKKR